MIECLQLRGLSGRTEEAYVRAVRQLADQFHKSPDLISEEELRQYFLFLKNVKKLPSELIRRELTVIRAPSGGAPPSILICPRTVSAPRILGNIIRRSAFCFDDVRRQTLTEGRGAQ
jgi:Phage integrase, N-terminal SAM-like domain